jgi:hypothetical protein
VEPKYWVLLDPPIPYAGGKEVRVVEYVPPNEETGKPPRAAYLDASYAVLARPTVVCHERGEPGQLRGCFRRGDSDSNGKVNLTDPIVTLTHLFRGGVTPTCLDAADFNDDGIVEITDPILVLTFLFQGVDLSTPPGPYDCGNDPTRDSLAPCDDAGCR